SQPVAPVPGLNAEMTCHVTWHEFADRPQRRQALWIWRGSLRLSWQDHPDVRHQQLIEQIARHELAQGRPHPDLGILGTERFALPTRAKTADDGGNNGKQ